MFGKSKEEKREESKETRTHNGEEPGKTPCHLPQKPKNVFFIKIVDLPCERTQHGKGPMIFTHNFLYHSPRRYRHES